MSARNSRSLVFGVLVITGFAGAFAFFLGVRPFEILEKADAKASAIMKLEAEHANLQKKYSELERDFFDLEKRHNALMAQMESKEEAERNLKLTGAKDGRSTASIGYSVPAGLSMEQKYLLAFSHMREKRFAEAAITFEAVLGSPEGALYQNSQAFYESGVAWFQVKNYKNSRTAFLAAKARAEGVQKPEMIRKVELWLMILEHKKHVGSQEE